jgi:hypothetical protein
VPVVAILVLGLALAFGIVRFGLRFVSLLANPVH